MSGAGTRPGHGRTGPAAATAGRGAPAAFSVAFFSIESILVTLMTSRSQRPGAGGLDRAWVRSGGPARSAGRPAASWSTAGRCPAAGRRRPGGRAVGGRPWPARRRRASRTWSLRAAGPPRRRTGRPAALRGWILISCPRVQLHQRPVGAGIQLAAQVLLRRRIQRPGHLDVEVPVDLHPGEYGTWYAPGGGSSTAPHSSAKISAGRAAMVPWIRIRRLPAPGLGPGLRIGQPGEALPGEEIPAHVLHGPFHLRLAPHRQLHLIRVIGTDASG